MVKSPSALARGVRLLFLVLFGIPLLPGSGEANPITIVSVSFPLSYQYVQFGSGPGFASDDGSFFDIYDDRLTGPRGDFVIDGGGFQLLSGPLVDVSAPPNSDTTYYVHDPGGFLSLSFNLQLPNGSAHAGSFFAPLLGLTIGARDIKITDGDVKAALGPGLFDDRTAKLLGVKPQTLPSDVQLYADTLVGSGPDLEVAAYGVMELRAEVPEPAQLLLIGMAVLVTVGWRTRRAIDQSDRAAPHGAAQ